MAVPGEVAEEAVGQRRDRGGLVAEELPKFSTGPFEMGIVEARP